MWYIYIYVYVYVYIYIYIYIFMFRCIVWCIFGIVWFLRAGPSLQRDMVTPSFRMIHPLVCIIYLYLFMCLSVCLSLSLSLYIYIYIHTYIQTYVCIYIYIYVYVCVYVCMYVCMYVCIYIYIYIIYTYALCDVRHREFCSPGLVGGNMEAQISIRDISAAYIYIYIHNMYDIRVSVCIYIYIYIHIYIYIYTHALCGLFWHCVIFARGASSAGRSVHSLTGSRHRFTCLLGLPVCLFDYSVALCDFCPPGLVGRKRKRHIFTVPEKGIRTRCRFLISWSRGGIPCVHRDFTGNSDSEILSSGRITCLTLVL